MLGASSFMVGNLGNLPVIPAQAGIQLLTNILLICDLPTLYVPWIPASAGMTALLPTLFEQEPNVMISRFMARIWVDETDACFVRFGDEAWGERYEVKDFFITLCEGESVLAGSRITIHK